MKASTGRLNKYFTSLKNSLYLIVGSVKNSMSPRNLKQYEGLMRKKASLIIVTALLRFSQDGYKSSSVLTIAKKVKISQPTAQILFTKIVEPFMKQYMQLFETYFERKGEKDPHISALLLGGAIDGISLDYLLMGEGYPMDKVVDKLIKKFK